ncbi:hypothetical protein M4951_15110 [Blastopirellula sp. J2-11]|uniref:hypothetical protein n=1 Tax=Blastopirellula sp. J2-11 TaxID=2943192 RepID=UPI0021C887E0|nr:hypothetical protein [Blastopirellula sp. J2-11]UUO04715.1 hypothetical protein M4951_15110 [Blastopirellula sp. J2-11]
MTHRVDHDYHRIRVLTLILSLACLGCGVPAAETVVNVDSFAVNHFTDQGVLWRKQETLTKEDHAILDRFFQSQPDWSDSTEVEGTPVVYASGDQRRFYWIRAAQKDAIWTCIHWEKKRFRATSGAGDLASSTN